MPRPRHAVSSPCQSPAKRSRAKRRPGSVDLEFESPGSGSVRPIATLGDAVEPLVIDDFVTEPAYDPVIGPDLAAARTRVGLTVDELAERTRIRPHVIESIEVDDFAPCGGDFYARGHLRTLARVLGQDPEPLLQKFDDRYATAGRSGSDCDRYCSHAEQQRFRRAYHDRAGNPAAGSARYR